MSRRWAVLIGLLFAGCAIGIDHYSRNRVRLYLSTTPCAPPVEEAAPKELPP